MPRFFFDVILGEERIDDVEGQDLPDLESARSAGIRVLEETLAHNLLRNEPVEDPILEILDAKGNLIERLRPAAPSANSFRRSRAPCPLGYETSLRSRLRRSSPVRSSTG